MLAEFKNEVQALSKIEHLNLVRFYGFLELRDERIIITEYVSNGTLREHLDGRSRKPLVILLCHVQLTGLFGLLDY